MEDKQVQDSQQKVKKYPDPAICTCLPFDAYPLLVLLCICFLTFGSYWVYDIPGAIFTPLQNYFEHYPFPTKYTNGMNLNLYSVYSYPNVILAFFGGILVDRLGVRFGSFTFCSLVFLGQIMFSFGVQFKQYWLCLFGRFTFGLGGESLTVAQNTYTARWFEGRSLALCFGIVVAFSRIGSSVNFAVTPQLANIGVPFAVWFGTIMCCVSFVACLIGATLDWYGEKRVRQISSDEKISIRHIFAFSIPVWVIFLLCVFFYMAILSFYTVASDIYQNSGFEYSPTKASLFIFIPNFISIFASPTFGFLIDRVGRSAFWCLIASCMLVVAHLAVLFDAILLDPLNQISPVPIMIWIGFAYALGASSLWPMVAFVVEPSKLGTAYGMMTAIQNAGLALAPEIVGIIQDAKIKPSLHYTIPIILFVCSAGVACVLSLLLLLLDKRYTGGKLSAPAAVRVRMIAEEAEIKRKLLGKTQEEDDTTAEVDEKTVLLPTGLLARSGLTIRSAYLSRVGLYGQFPIQKTEPRPDIP